MPFIVGIITRLAHPNYWFRDFDAVSCGGEALNAHHPLYTSAYACLNAKPTTYVYTPLGAQFFALVQRDLGVTGEIALYGGIFWMLVYVVFKGLVTPDKNLALRAPFLAGVPGNAIWSGNLSIVFHGLFYACRHWLPRRPVLFAPLLTTVIAIKPTFVVYLALFLFLDRALLTRVLLIAACSASIGLYFVGFYLWDHASFISWQALTHYYGLINDRGDGFLALPYIDHWQGIPFIGCAYAVFALLILGAGLIISKHRLRAAEERILLGISVCLLLYPRLMNYDMFTLPFGLALIAASFEGFGAITSAHLRRVMMLVCSICMVLSLAGNRFGDKAIYVFACLMLLFVAASIIRAEVRARGGKSIGSAVRKAAAF